MKHQSKQNRHYSNLCGRKFVNDFRGLNYHPTFDTEVFIPGKYAQVDVTLNLGSHPMPKVTDVSPLEQMKANMEVRPEYVLERLLHLWQRPGAADR